VQLHYTITLFELIPMFQAHTEDRHRLHAAPQSVQVAAGRRRTVPPRRGRPPNASKSAFTPPVGQRVRG
jgi:hypothetical protein